MHCPLHSSAGRGSTWKILNFSLAIEHLIAFSYYFWSLLQVWMNKILAVIFLTAFLHAKGTVLVQRGFCSSLINAHVQIKLMPKCKSSILKWPAIQRVHPSSLTFCIRYVCSNKTRAPIANPPDSAQLRGTPYHSTKWHPGLCNSVAMQQGTDTITHRQTAVITTHFAWLCLMRNVTKRIWTMSSVKLVGHG